MSSHKCELLVRMEKSVQEFSALFYFNNWKSFYKFMVLFCLTSTQVFPSSRGRDCNVGSFSGLFFTLVTSAVSPRAQNLRESQWHSEEMLKQKLHQAAEKLLDPALLPEKCLCNYTINMMFNPMLYKTNWIAYG